MRVLFKEDHTAPVAISSVWVGAGALYEWPDVRGWSHGIEHNLFKGTNRRGPGDISRDIKAAGGTLNAGTGYSMTMYYITLPSGNFDVALDIHADVMQNSTFDSAEFERERNVLIQENQMYRDQPQGFGFTWERLMRLMFNRHPFRYPLGGSDDKLRKTTRAEVLKYFRKFYVPANMVYVVVGDLDYDNWRPRIEKAFADMPTKPAPQRNLLAEPAQRQLRYKAYSGQFNKGYLKIGFKGPGELHPDNHALDILLRILTSGSGSRLVKLLRDQRKLVSGISGMAEDCSNTQALVLDMVLDPGNLTKVLKLLFQEIDRLCHEPVETRELALLRRAAESNLITAMETVEGQANLLGHNELLGDYHSFYYSLDTLRNLTTSDLLRVARSYLTPDKISILYHHPEQVTAPTIEQVRAIAQKGPGRTRKLKSPVKKLPEVNQRFKLSNGMPVITQYVPQLPLISTGVFAGYGQRLATLNNNPLPQFLQRLWSSGSRRFSEEDIIRSMEDIAGELLTFSSQDVTGCYLLTESRDLHRGLDILGDIVSHPLFSDEILQREQQLAVQQLRQLPDNPRLLAQRNLMQMLLGDKGYGLFPLGDDKGINKVTRRSLQAAYRKHFTPDNMLIGVVGDFNRDTLGDELEKAFGGHAKGRSFQAKQVVYPPIKGVQRQEINLPVNQSVVLLGFPGVVSTDNDHLTLAVLSTILSGMGNRLFNNLREKRALCYYTGIARSSYRDAGTITAWVGTQVGREEEALQALLDELRLVVQEGITKQELQRARSELAGHLALDMQRNADRLMLFARLEMRGKSFTDWRQLIDRVNHISLDQVNRVARRYLDLNNHAISIVRP
jgi:zinc protease